MMQKKRILVAPLDWGIGHATRCIPVIKRLIDHGYEVVIGAANKPLSLLKKEFPELEFILLPGMNVAYPRHLPMSVFMVLRAPKFFKWIKLEHEMLKSVVKNYGIDAVISDNRYGLTHPEIPTIIITHQLFIRAGLFSWVIKKITEKHLLRFNYCWIPDYAGEINLSGALSHGKTRLNNIRYIGPLSRFSIPKYHRPEIRYDLLVVLSGPEPSRSILEENIMKQLRGSELKVLLVRGLVDAEKFVEENIGNITRLNYLNSKDLQKAVLISKMVLCRSGYSSIMDLSVLKARAFFVPTKGQTEQVYLAKALKKKGMAFYTSRKSLDINKYYNKALSYKGLDIEVNTKDLDDALQELSSLLLYQNSLNPLTKVS